MVEGQQTEGQFVGSSMSPSNMPGVMWAACSAVLMSGQWYYCCRQDSRGVAKHMLLAAHKCYATLVMHERAPGRECNVTCSTSPSYHGVWQQRNKSGVEDSCGVLRTQLGL